MRRARLAAFLLIVLAVVATPRCDVLALVEPGIGEAERYRIAPGRHAARPWLKGETEAEAIEVEVVFGREFECLGAGDYGAGKVWGVGYGPDGTVHHDSDRFAWRYVAANGTLVVTPYAYREGCGWKWGREADAARGCRPEALEWIYGPQPPLDTLRPGERHVQRLERGPEGTRYTVERGGRVRGEAFVPRAPGEYRRRVRWEGFYYGGSAKAPCGLEVRMRRVR